jgi:hypothetical protein
MDPSWSETGDRYLIKLFRDHLFHQVTETGEPWLDMSHIISSLNKVRKLHKLSKEFLQNSIDKSKPLPSSTALINVMYNNELACVQPDLGA